MRPRRRIRAPKRDAAGRASHGPPARVEDVRPGAGPPPLPICRQAMQAATAAQRGKLEANGVTDAHGLRALFGDGDQWGWTPLDLLRAAMQRIEAG